MFTIVFFQTEISLLRIFILFDLCLLTCPVKEEKPKEDTEDDISQGSESKSDSNCQSSTTGLDSDHDYTLIGSSSPTHTEDRWVNVCFLTLH